MPFGTQRVLGILTATLVVTNRQVNECFGDEPSPISACDPKAPMQRPFLLRPKYLHRIDRGGAKGGNNRRDQAGKRKQRTDGEDLLH